ncbi:MAG: type II restriction endonuclease [Fibrobacteraceae bacterium]
MQSYVSDAIKVTTFGIKTFCKFLSANDTIPEQSHQSGIYIPKNSSSILFHEPGEKGKNKNRLVSIKWFCDDEFFSESRFIYYGAGTRNEYRITRTPIFHSEYTGALFVLVQSSFDEYQAFIFNTDDEINQYLDAFGLSPSDTNCLINQQLKPIENESALIQKFIAELDQKGIEFPKSERMSAAARLICDNIYNHKEYIIQNPDQKIIDWSNVEFDVFKAIEYSRYGAFVKNGFSSVDAFINVANQVLNRRKSRAGKSLEHHLSAIFDGNNIHYDSQVVTEGNKKPDFIFPSKEAYHDITFPSNKLISLAAKTTCKDRWRQIINEADRLKNDCKYLCTLQQGISAKQMDEMQAEKVILVVPKPYIMAYPKEKRDRIWTIGKFISFVKNME